MEICYKLNKLNKEFSTDGVTLRVKGLASVL